MKKKIIHFIKKHEALSISILALIVSITALIVRLLK